MNKPKLDPDILLKIVERTGLKEKTIRNEISSLKLKYPRCTLNAIAQLYASQYGFSVMQKLSKEDKETLPNHEVEKTVIKLKQKKTNPKEKIVELIKYETSDHFQKGHISEVNRAYSKGCYTAAFILTRKVIENLIIDLLRTKYPPSSKENKELYYDISRGRYKDFEEVLTKLHEKRNEFHINSIKKIKRLYEKAMKFKKSANDAAHSWFYLVKNKTELEDLEIRTIVELLKSIEKEL